ncbi:cytochrome P450 [Rhizorhabdus dicambivorans]|uniref:Cytochrome P450 n=1 Tax=Rhizorhabdus dicambivorans TaxID=1850238 RepID=A0A2A4FSH2_9SPHN|nr:cytochrome P450 [Rhizorhabdus dicambivorans]ATE66359.1 cytochrome P450 [Rhizorhabdus dicambivorans]PCE40398.1 cytochrome P450 [Rhizorhabdus dicambivorans]
MIPTVDVNLYSPDTLAYPYEAYRTIRDAGPVCRLAGSDLLAIGRHADLRTALADWQSFSSGSGVAMNAPMNAALRGTILGADPPEHQRLRDIVGRPLTPARLGALRQRIYRTAEQRVDELVARGTFCAATDLAHYLPITVVSELVGLPEEGRQRMLDWAASAFDAMAPLEAGRFEAAMPVIGDMIRYVRDPALPARLVADGWAAQLYAAVDAGEIDKPFFESLIQAYLAPSLDTTIFATSNLIWLFAHHPDQWQKLRERPALIPRAINEALRLESPASGFSRLVSRPVRVDGIDVPEGSRVVMLFASGNRDERRYQDPDRFDIERDSSDHLAFGHALHRCVGMNLALLEMTALLSAMLPRVSEITLNSERRADNAVLRGFAELNITVR